MMLESVPVPHRGFGLGPLERFIFGFKGVDDDGFFGGAGDAAASA